MGRARKLGRQWGTCLVERGPRRCLIEGLAELTLLFGIGQLREIGFERRKRNVLAIAPDVSPRIDGRGGSGQAGGEEGWEREIGRAHV